MKVQKLSTKTCSSLSKGKRALVLDVGTTGIKAFIFSENGEIITKVYQKISKNRPKQGWVEQDPMEILKVSKEVLQRAVKSSSKELKNIIGLGITNQREAIVVWNKKTGRPVYPIIGWEDRRTQAFCSKFKQKEKFIRERTGLPILPYFSASKIKWIFDQHKDASNLIVGTIDTWLLWNLGASHPHLTDETNASRTLLFDIRKRAWSKELCELFSVKMQFLPKVQFSASRFGTLKKEIFGKAVPIIAVCGDQQSSTFAAIQKGNKDPITKVTYGTGVFVSQVLGNKYILQKDFFTTLVPGKSGKSIFALEAKLEGSGEMVTSLLNQPKKLEAYFRSLARKVDQQIKKLPRKPKILFLDGGIVRDGSLPAIQSKVSGIKCRIQRPYDGTALGTAMLVFKSKKMS